VSKTHFVGECNPGDRTSWAVARAAALEDTDADADLMPDACDPGPFSPHADLRGDFTRSTDLDQDGVDDAFDNCPPSYCEEVLGLPAAFCFNPYPTSPFAPQPDEGDGDGIGDACDACPHHDGPFQSLVDPDGDGVDVMCDNCETGRNRRAACTADEQCSTTSPSGQTEEGFCTAIGLWGRCSGTHWACADDADCPDPDGFGGLPPETCDRPEGTCSASLQPCSFDNDCPAGQTCEDAAPIGRCSRQTDDENLNFVGGECDPCDESPSVPGAPLILANSNDIAERREHAPPLGDACDPVPVYSTKPVTVSVTLGPPPFDPTKRTLFTASAGHGGPPGLGGLIGLEVGHRWCNCRLDGQNLDALKCWKRCQPQKPDDAYGSPGSDYEHVTTAVSPITSDPRVTPPAAGSDVERLKVFANAVWLDPEPHPFGDTEQHRVGLPEFLVWDHATDIAARPLDFPTYLDATTEKTAGLLWSHVLDDGSRYVGGATPGSRDYAYYTTEGVALDGLRDNYVRVDTPALNLLKFVAFPPLTECHLLNNCQPWWRGDLIADIGSVVNPAILAQAQGAGLLACGADGCAIAAVGGNIDVTGLVTPAAASLLGDTSLVFLSPVEHGRHTDARSSGGAIMLGMPRSFSSAVTPIPIVTDGDAIRPLGEIICEPECPLPGPGLASASGSGPADRQDPAYAFSLKQGVVIMAGGALQDGSPAREIWRNDLRGSGWELLLRGDPAAGPLDDPAPRDVVALGYDSHASLAAFVDHTTMAKKHGRKIPIARLVLFDVARELARVALVLPRLGVFERVDLVARGDGSWVLVGQVRHTGVWKAFELRLSIDADPVWTGFASGKGAIVNAPVNTSQGVLLPVLKKGKLELVFLGASAFHGRHAGPVSM
jgi:hypothetical protein